ncbi:hypothetical protein AAC387_Pa04g1759 [Persea americana]
MRLSSAKYFSGADLDQAQRPISLFFVLVNLFFLPQAACGFVPTVLLAQFNSGSGSMATMGKKKHKRKGKAKVQQKKKGALLHLREAWALSCGLSG